MRSSDSYAQNLYCALCNTDWQKQELWPVLQDETWACTWRTAGAIVADLKDSGDYLDWYCSGIGNKDTGNVTEGIVTPEIESDLKDIGWICVEETNPMDL